MIANLDELMAKRTATVLRDLRRDALGILDQALQAVDPEKLMEGHFRREGDLLEGDGLRLDLAEVESLRLLAVGKASLAMTRAALRLVDPEETLVITAADEAQESENFTSIPASHPLPGEGSLLAGKAALGLAGRTGPRDLFVVLISGGASSMMEDSSLPLDALEDTTRILLRSGMHIGSMNVVRKHLSRVKGGWLGTAAGRRGGRGLALALSDVVGDDPAAIASGPTVPDPSTFQDARHLLEDHDLWDSLPDAVRKHLRAGVAGAVPETPKPGEPSLERFPFRIVGGIGDAADEAIAEGRRRRYATYTFGTQVEGEVREVAASLLASAVAVQETGHPVAPPALIVFGGETTFEVRGGGKGGRNMELVLAAVRGLHERPIVLLSCDTDGQDGETNVAGAIADGESLAQALQRGIEPEAFQAESDSYGFFSRLEDTIKTGPTGTNVMDLQLVLIGPAP